MGFLKLDKRHGSLKVQSSILIKIISVTAVHKIEMKNVQDLNEILNTSLENT